jgi:hypothetical protein
MLPPIVQVPQPKPKKIENRKSRIQMRAGGAIADAADIEDINEFTGPGGTNPAANRSPPQNFAAIEGSEEKPRRAMGRLSENTLKVMLLAQEWQ